MITIIISEYIILDTYFWNEPQKRGGYQFGCISWFGRSNKNDEGYMLIKIYINTRIILLKILKTTRLNELPRDMKKNMLTALFKVSHYFL